ncbi:thiazole tautomerase (transcriptional regulator TenI) [Bacillus pakistanensis]|uniref:Thiazole tautomerase (Transcriptional regulator TenI) n=1 Tax=Rossellomorea pakistanensis TaxID=992288 RepID=A0ABS2NDB7_9BACI|nr:thiazole tautomerase TenI [Bacillus pakistanensis]MBM7585739.1 thiazole tautomerase (transcriptional regulator TenI) [Bacillus pakistanensis]
MNRQLHVISTGQQSKEEFGRIASTIHEYVDGFHLREKKWTAKELVAAIQSLSEQGVPLEKIIVNDRGDVAHSMKTGGVQLAHHSMDASLVKKAFPALQIGCSVHSLAEAMGAEKKGANRLLYGHIFSTASKPGVPPRGLRELGEIVQNVTIPVFAIGGITPGNVEEVLATGVEGIAVLSGILKANDPLEAVLEYRKKMKGEG